MTQRIFAVALLSGWAWAAPLFPTSSSPDWVQAAWVRLVDEGLVEASRGGRAMSRQELAELLARLLKKQTRADDFGRRVLLQQLLQQLEEDRSPRTVAVSRLQEQIHSLNQRTQELERITFYGSLESRVVAQAFRNEGSPDNQALLGLPPLDFNRTVGSSSGPTLRPQLQGVIPVVDYRNGRALLNGVGFTALARLGVKLNFDPANQAGLELAAFSSQGNQNIDAYFGVNGPYLANPWTMNQNSQFGLQGESNRPFSRAVLDHLWYEHKPSHTKVRLGTFEGLRMDPFVYAGQGGNNNLYSSGRFPGFGLQLWGQADLADQQELRYEVFASRFGDGGNVFQNSNYTHTAVGGDLAYVHQGTDVKLNWVQYQDDSPGASQALTGLDNLTNVAYLNSPRWSQVQWVNPAGYLALQRSAEEIAQTVQTGSSYLPNQFDTRPIPGWNGDRDNAQGLNQGGGNFGAQGQMSYGLSFHHWIPLDSNKEGLKITGEYGRSQYQSNRRSAYIAQGQAARLDLGAVLLGGDLTLNLQALRVDPTYNPALFNAALLGIRFVRPYNFLGRYHLFDSNNYPHNRQGVGLRGQYCWNEARSSLSWKAGFYQQTRTSLYDVRLPGGSLGPSVPTNDVVGFAPGFIDPIFSGLAHPNLYGAGSKNSFDAQLQPLENPRGHTSELALAFKHRFEEPTNGSLSLDCAWERNHYFRASSLSPALGGSQNLVDLTSEYANLGLAWGVAPGWTLRPGVEWVHVVGHHDPGGLYNSIALARGSNNFKNIDSQQFIPALGLEHQLSKNSSWGLEARYYHTVDHSLQGLSWSGPQVSSFYKLTF